MRIHPLSRAVTVAVLGCGLSMPMLAHAEFVEDSKLDLSLRNFYMNRDFRQDTPLPKVKGKTPAENQSYSEEWAQGFLLNLQSGYTEGMVGFGVDAMGLLGVRLDSGQGRSGTGLLPVGASGEVPEEYSSAAANAKMQISKSNIKAGTAHRLRLPVVQASDIRLLPQVFEGFHGNMLEISGLNFNAGQLTGVKQRASTDREDMRLNGGNIALKGTDSFQFAGADYALTDTLKATYYYGELEDYYDQHAVGLLWTQPLSDGQVLSLDLRYQDSSNSGDEYAKTTAANPLGIGLDGVDNEAYQAMLGYKIGAHSFAAAYQQMDGDSLFPYISETDPWLVNYVQIGNFASAEEKSWQARYILDFASYGIPGLSLMTRYVSGDNIKIGSGAASNNDGKEWERDTDIAYMIQEGSLKGLEIRWRNATYRSNLLKSTRDLDENRLIVNYNLAIW